MSSMNSAEIQYIWEAIRESERSDENLLADDLDPSQGTLTLWMKKLHRQMRFAVQQLGQKSQRGHEAKVAARDPQ